MRSLLEDNTYFYGKCIPCSEEVLQRGSNPFRQYTGRGNSLLSWELCPQTTQTQHDLLQKENNTQLNGETHPTLRSAAVTSTSFVIFLHFSCTISFYFITCLWIPEDSSMRVQ
jgi:hypothetical protein